MEVPAKSNAFQIKPDLENIIPPAEVKKIIQQTLNDTLLSKIKIFSNFYKNLNIFQTKHTRLITPKCGQKALLMILTET